MMYTLKRVIAGVLMLSAPLGAGHALASDYAKLDGQTIRVIIGSAPAETTDMLARAYFKQLGALLPDTTIRIQNLEGGNKAYKELQAASGSVVTLEVGSRSGIYKQLVKPDEALDLTKFTWVASLSPANRLFAVRASLPKTSADAILAMKEPLKVGALGFDSSAFEPLLINALTKFRLKVVQGMKEGERHVMIMNGDLDARSGSLFELGPLFDNKEMAPVLKFRPEGLPPAFDNVPALADFVDDAASNRVLSTIETLDRVGGVMIAASAGIDPETLDALRKAGAAAGADPAFLREADALRATISFTDGETLAKVLAPILDPASGVGDEVRAAIECGQVKSETGSEACK